ncbi:hypothetical protein CMO89_02535 [Candidatus Woesearchaeota archaeon]|nr:hypothetical protein [Candidatus Woesearchaeota archaeon]|tara:strand:+ start:808 stop:1236 length:429 start_codon:yes stop_codon:yes gene_type:complete
MSDQEITSVLNEQEEAALADPDFLKKTSPSNILDDEERKALLKDYMTEKRYLRDQIKSVKTTYKRILEGLRDLIGVEERDSLKDKIMVSWCAVLNVTDEIAGRVALLDSSRSYGSLDRTVRKIGKGFNELYTEVCAENQATK